MADHMQRMRGIRNAADRRVYLEGVERSQGKAWRDAARCRVRGGLGGSRKGVEK